MRRTEWHQNYPIWKLFWVIDTKTLIQGFRFNNPKQFSNWINFVSFCSSHLVVQIATMFILWKFKKSVNNSKIRQNSSLKDQSSQLQSDEKMIYSERSWKMEHFLFLRHVLNRCSFRDNCVWICVQALRCNTQTFLNF